MRACVCCLALLVLGCGGADGETEAYVVDAGQDAVRKNIPLDDAGLAPDSDTAACGNGIREELEECDQGATPRDDCPYGVEDCVVCTTGCRIEKGRASYCGDGVRQPPETCDDGNRTTEACPYGVALCTVCTSDCALAAGVTSICGDRSVTDHEQCDDGNAVTEECTYGIRDCTVCDSACRFSNGRTAYCGDGVVNGDEQCDDGNATTEFCPDGATACTVCTGTCRLGPGRLRGSSESHCGNGQVDPDEECDDGNTETERCRYGDRSCTVCDATCRLRHGAVAYCGDGIRTDAEQCDDGNEQTESCPYGQASCSVCDSTCRSVAGLSSYCGDGAVSGPEQCDDGNNVTESCPQGQSTCTVCGAACQWVAVSATGPAVLAVAPMTTSDFGSVAVGTSAVRTFKVTNSGAQPATLGTISTGGLSLAAPFAHTGGTCTTGQVLPETAGQNFCTFTLTFAPVIGGAAQDTIAVGYHNGLGFASATQAISGTGLGLAALAVTADTSADFGSVGVGASVARTFTVTNQGGQAATLGTISTAGLGLVGSFAHTGGTCSTGGGLAASGGSNTCTITITFTPAGLGVQNATISLPYHDGVANQTATLPLVGSGVSSGILAISDGPSYPFGTVYYPDTSCKTFTVSNVGAGTATLSSTLDTPSLGLSGSFSYQAGGTCAASAAIGPSASCTLTVCFFSAIDIVAADSLELHYDNGAGQASVTTRALTGHGYGGTPTCTGGALSAAPFAAGSGTELDPYIICTPAQWNAIGAGQSYVGIYFRQGKSIDMGSVTVTSAGSTGTPFRGSYDGSGFSFVDVSFTGAAADVGLFGVIGSGASITRLHVELGAAGLSAAGATSVGGLVGRAMASSTISSTSVGGAGAVTGRTEVGGVVGRAAQDAAIANVSSTVAVTAVDVWGVAGGVAGVLDGSLARAIAAGEVTSPYIAGGLVGSSDTSLVWSITESIATGTSTGGSRVGGLMGFAYSGTITRSYATGTVVATSEAGGLIGRAELTQVTDAYAQGNVVSDGGSFATGLVGFASQTQILNAYATGSVTGTSAFLAGALANDPASAQVGVFWDFETTGQDESYRSHRRSTAQMSDRNTYLNADWNFDTVWRMPQGGGYPIFQWQVPRDTVALAALFDGGSGTTIDPYLISSTSTLKNMPYALQLSAPARAASYRLTQTLDLMGSVPPVVGTLPYPFSGTFDGQSYQVTNVDYVDMTHGHRGFFGYLASGASIERFGVTLAGNGVRGYDQYVGGLVGSTHGTVTLSSTNVSGSGGVQAAWDVGGLVGSASSDTTIAHAWSSAAVTSTGIGGIAGGLAGISEGTVYRSQATGTVSSAQYAAGGLIGSTGASMTFSVTESFATGTTTGVSDVGGLLGRAGAGFIRRCYATGNVVGPSVAGGLVGRAELTTITDVYARGNVLADGGQYAAGLIGFAGGGAVVTNGYASGLVTGTSATQGGALADSPNPTSIAIFWDTQTSAQATSSWAHGRTTAHMMDRTTFINADWNFDTIWRIPPGGGYPVLQWETPRASVTTASLFSGGTGASDSPYLISSTTTLQNIGFALQIDAAARAAHYRVTQSLDFAGVVPPVIGTQAYPFSGTFSGDGHEVQNLDYIDMTHSYRGFFGYLDSGAYVERLSLTLAGAGVRGYSQYVGGLAGFTNGNVTLSSTTVSGLGPVSAATDVGGLVGRTSVNTQIVDSQATVSVSSTGLWSIAGGLIGVSQGTISRCHAGGNVESTWSAGGLVGGNDTSTTWTIADSYATGNVTGLQRVGGLMGYSTSGAIARAYASGSVVAPTEAGGLLGRADVTTIENVFATGPVTADGGSYAGGLIGYVNSSAITSAYAIGAISGTSTDKGGLAGASSGTLTGCFWNQVTTGQATSAGGTSASTADMTLTDSAPANGVLDLYVNAGWLTAVWALAPAQYPRLLGLP